MNGRNTILVVDDSYESLTLLDTILTKAGYQVQPADSGEVALALVAQKPLDLVLLDVQLQGISGHEVCRRLKDDGRTRHIPIIMISAFADVQEWVQGLQLGAADYVSKPFQAEELLSRVKTQLTLKRSNTILEQKSAELRGINERLQAEIISRRQVEEQLRANLERSERSRRAMLSALEDHRQALAALHESENKFKHIFDNSVSGILTTKLTGEVHGNRSFCAMLGYSEEEMNTRNWVAISHPDDIEYTRQVVNDLLSGEKKSVRFVKRYLHKNGSIVWADIGTYLYRNSDGQALYFISSVNDISENKRAEEEKQKLEAQLQQAQKMESVGRLAGGVAHDFNNMLSVILGYAEMVMAKTDPSSELYADLQEIHNAGVRSANITRQLLAFARKQTINPEVLDLNETVESILKMLRRLIGEDIDLTWQPVSGIWPIHIDPSQLDQILANICVNARDAISGIGKITIETDMVRFNEEYCNEHCGFVPGEFALLSVSDSGCGMGKEVLEKLFEPFFTTKETGKGTGLGLATVYGIVKQNNGFINVYSEPGKGSKFKIYLPRYREEGGKVEKPGEAAIEKGQGETVLVVEDEQSILRLTAKILERLGYRVVTCMSPSQAIAWAEEHGQEGPDLLITDVIMPQMNGRDLADALQRIFPDLRCLFMSGYTATVIASQGVLEAGVHFIQKPFSAGDLAKKVREALP